MGVAFFSVLGDRSTATSPLQAHWLGSGPGTVDKLPVETSQSDEIGDVRQRGKDWNAQFSACRAQGHFGGRGVSLLAKVDSEDWWE